MKDGQPFILLLMPSRMIMWGNYLIGKAEAEGEGNKNLKKTGILIFLVLEASGSYRRDHPFLARVWTADL